MLEDRMERLREAIARARKHVMTQAERDEQAINFAYGNVKLSNPNATLEGVRAAFERLKQEKL